MHGESCLRRQASLAGLRAYQRMLCAPVAVRLLEWCTKFLLRLSGNRQLGFASPWRAHRHPHHPPPRNPPLKRRTAVLPLVCSRHRCRGQSVTRSPARFERSTSANGLSCVAGWIGNATWVGWCSSTSVTIRASCRREKKPENYDMNLKSFLLVSLILSNNYFLTFSQQLDCPCSVV